MIIIGKQALNYYKDIFNSLDDYEILDYSKSRSFILNINTFNIKSVMDDNNMIIYNYSYDNTAHSKHTPIGDILVAPKEVLKYYAIKNNDREVLTLFKNIELSPFLMKLLEK